MRGEGRFHRLDRRVDLHDVLRAIVRLRVLEDVTREHADDALALVHHPGRAQFVNAGERRGRRGLAADSHHVDLPFRGEYLRVGYLLDDAVGLANRGYGLVVTDRIADADGAGDSLGGNAMARLERLHVASKEGIRPLRLNRRESRCPVDPAVRAGFAESFAEGAGVTEVAGRDDDPVRWLPAQILQELPDDRLLTFDAPRIDRVDEVDAEAVGGVADEAHGRVEVTADRECGRAVRQSLGELATRDFACGHEDDRAQSGLRSVGGQ